jgi:hypothetical protein
MAVAHSALVSRHHRESRRSSLGAELLHMVRLPWQDVQGIERELRGRAQATFMLIQNRIGFVNPVLLDQASRQRLRGFNHNLQYEYYPLPD